MKYSSLKQTKILFWSFEKKNLFWNKKISQARLYQILQPYPYIFIRTFTKKHTYHSTQKSNHYPLEGAWSFAYQAVNNWASLTAFYEVKKVIFFSSNWSTQISSPVNKSIRISFIRKIQIWEFRKKTVLHKKCRRHTEAYPELLKFKPKTKTRSPHMQSHYSYQSHCMHPWAKYSGKNNSLSYLVVSYAVS